MFQINNISYQAIYKRAIILKADASRITMFKANIARAHYLLGRVDALSNMSKKLMSRNISIHWKRKDNSTLTTEADVGKTLLQVAHKYNIELEGACEGVWLDLRILFN